MRHPDPQARPLIPMRAVHLDFHTSRDFTVGEHFDPGEFAGTMAAAHVASVNVFAKCHHGYSYYPTTVGTRHPGLGFDLLGGQIEALHSRGIRAPIYLSVLWDDLAAELHPDWVAVDRDGRALIRRPLSSDSPLRGQVGWSTMDLASEYAEYVRAQVTELCLAYPVDGFWFDIVWPEPSYSPQAQARMRAAGVQLDDADAVWHHYRGLARDLMTDLHRIVTGHHPTATVFGNGTVDAAVGDLLPSQTHLEIESLPTSGDLWGYTHYPVVARYARTQAPIVGMTGRFQAAWADFGGLKTPAQLTYEVGTIVGAGGGVSIGDQLHPDGRLDPAVYRTIGRVYSRLARIEHLWHGAQRVREVAVLGDWRREPTGGHLVATHTTAVAAAVQALVELAVQVDVVDPAEPDLTAVLAGYRAVVVPDAMVVPEAVRTALAAHRDGGGTVLLSGDTPFAADDAAAWDLPLDDLGPAPTVPCYVRPTVPGDGDLAPATDYDYVLYDGARLVRPHPGTHTEGRLRRAAFDRTWEHYTSHLHAPVAAELDAPLLVAGESVVYLAAPLWQSYGQHQYWVYRSFLARAVELALGEQTLVRAGPAWIEAGVHTQAGDDGVERYVINLVAFQPRRSPSPVPRVDEAGATAGVRLSLRPEPGFEPRQVRLEPDGTELDHRMVDGRLLVDLPPVGTHTVVVVQR